MQDLSATIVRLNASFSLEITPREIRKISGLREQVRRGAPVYVTFLANTAFADTVETVRRLAAAGLRPVPHLAARAIRDRRHLDEELAALAGEGGVEEVLVVAGSIPEPVGDFDASIQILRSGCLERRGIRRVGVAGHPEGSPWISDEDLRQALKEKNEFDRDSELELYLLTQFCFAAEPVVAWEHRIRAEGNQLPVHVGLPGLASSATLLKFGLSCGAGPSLKVLREQGGNILRLATSVAYHPDQTMVRIARAASSDREALFRQFHFYPFGAVSATAHWAQAVADGRFSIDPTADRIEAQG